MWLAGDDWVWRWINEWRMRMSRIAGMNGVKGEGGMTEYNDEWKKNENESDSWDEWGEKGVRDDVSVTMNEWRMRMSRIVGMNGVKGEGGMTEYNDEGMKNENEPDSWHEWGEGGMTEYNDEWMKNENEPDSWDEWGSPEIVISDKENSTALPPIALNNIV